MTSSLWTFTEETTLKDLVSQQWNSSNIAKRFKHLYETNTVGFVTLRGPKAIERKLSRLGIRLSDPTGSNPIVPPKAKAPAKSLSSVVVSETIEEPLAMLSTESFLDEEVIIDESTFTKQIDNLRYLYNKFGEEGESIGIPTTGRDRFILSLSDLHIPFAPPDRILRILNHFKGDLADNGLIVLNGDLMDQYDVSHFSKYKEIPLIQEYRATYDLIKICLSFCNKVALTRGNHEVRLQRFMKDKLPTNVLNLFESDLLLRLSRGDQVDFRGRWLEPDKDMAARVLYQMSEPWYIRVGKTIFCHPSGYGDKTPGGTVKKAHRLFRMRYDRVDFDSVVCAHTHSQYMGVIDNYLLMEQGSLNGRLGYEHTSALPDYGHSQNGFAVIVQDSDGSCNFNESRFYNIGSMVPKKKKLIV